MRRNGLWHPRLVEILTSSGHGDLIVVADAGLPVPAGVETVDLVWRADQPPFLPVLRAVVEECVVEHATLATELADAQLSADISEALDTIPVERIPHEVFKATSARARAIVRTGTTTPYANVLLRCGVAF